MSEDRLRACVAAGIVAVGAGWLAGCIVVAGLLGSSEPLAHGVLGAVLLPVVALIWWMCWIWLREIVAVDLLEWLEARRRNDE